MSNQTELNDLFMLIIGTLTTVLAVSTTIFFAFIYQRKLYKKQAEYREIEKLLKREELKSTYALLEGEEKERKRISEDLHDNLGSILSTILMHIDTFLEKDKPATLQNTALTIEKLARHAADETRRISHNLDSGLLKHFGLKVAISQLCEAISQSEKVSVDAVIHISQDLDGDLSLNIYRMIQELFSNTLKHAKATKVRIEITQIPGEYLNLIFEDNGKGFLVKDQQQKGLGLYHLQSRIHRFSGELTIDSSENIGTTVIIEIPLRYGESNQTFSS